METIKKIASKAFAAIAILGVFVAICTADDSAHEFIMRLIGTGTFIIGFAGWTLTGKETV